ncbi:hypothetical protein ACRASO_002850 [Yersinia enterocolitica]|nr:hypothetical protein [Yersinia enterocolitica]
MTLESIIKKLNSEFDSGEVTSSWLKKHAANRLNKKLERIKNRLCAGGIHIYPEDWGKELLYNEYYFFCEYKTNNSELYALFRTEVHAEFLLMKKFNQISQDKLLDRKDGKALEEYRYKKRLVFSDENTIKSWSNIDSLSSASLESKIGKPYTKHLYKKANLSTLNNSMYAKDIDPEKIEQAVLQYGCGYFESADRAFFCGYFDTQVGYTPNGNGGEPSNFIKLQVDRVPRPYRVVNGKKQKQKQGYYFKMHGYPISQQEAERDFKIHIKTLQQTPLNSKNYQKT